MTTIFEVQENGFQGIHLGTKYQGVNLRVCGLLMQNYLIAQKNKARASRFNTMRH